MSTENTTPLKAYELRYRNGYNEPCAIVYAKNSREAHKQYDAIDGATYIATETRRAPEFDGYPRGPTVTDLLTKHSWWFGCQECGEDVRHDRHPGLVVADEDRHHPMVFCGPTCAATRPTHEAERARRHTETMRVVEAALSRTNDVRTP